MAELSNNMAFRLALDEEMGLDEKVVCYGEDLGKRGGCWGNFSGLQAKYGEDRIVEFPIAEMAFSGMATGAAMMGFRPVVEFMFADFVTLGFESIVDIAAKYRFNACGKKSMPVTWILPQGAGAKSGCHHSQCVEAWFTNVPGLKIVTPSTAADTRAFLRAAIRDDDPVLFIYQRALMGVAEEVPDTLDAKDVPSLKNAGKIVKEGKDLTVVAYHRALVKCIEAAKQVEAETGKTIEIIDPRVLIPFDKEKVFESVRKTGRLMVAHEAPKRGAYGAQIVDYVVEEIGTELKTNPVRVGGLNTIIPFGNLEDHVLPSIDDMKAGMMKALS